ncbi:hypothetical protein VTN49DRAFT_6191 [Thermomyces lanuginosus]|uniref:uncharacterized protein n=1 Tax=Thermomyces lanuginosus TaxID=5541 RepID=UPI003743473B
MAPRSMQSPTWMNSIRASDPRSLAAGRLAEWPLGPSPRFRFRLFSCGKVPITDSSSGFVGEGVGSPSWNSNIDQEGGLFYHRVPYIWRHMT